MPQRRPELAAVGPNASVGERDRVAVNRDAVDVVEPPFGTGHGPRARDGDDAATTLDAAAFLPDPPIAREGLVGNQEDHRRLAGGRGCLRAGHALEPESPGSTLR